MTIPDGPLTGAPIGFPDEGGNGEACCAPLLGPYMLVELDFGSTIITPDPTAAPAQNTFVPEIEWPEDTTTVDVALFFQKMDDPSGAGGASVQVIPVGTGQPAISPVSITELTWIPAVDPEYDRLNVRLDVTGTLATMVGSLLITNDCGCCTQVAMRVSAA